MDVLLNILRTILECSLSLYLLVKRSMKVLQMFLKRTFSECSDKYQHNLLQTFQVCSDVICPHSRNVVNVLLNVLGAFFECYCATGEEIRV